MPLRIPKQALDYRMDGTTKQIWAERCIKI